MGQTFVCGENRGSVKEDDRPLFQEYEIRGFQEGLIANPIFNNRFRNIPTARILLIANQVLEILRLSVKQESIAPFDKVLDLHVLMNIREKEMDAFIDLFLRECRIEGEIFWDQYENILKRMKKRLMGNHIAIGGCNRVKFYTQVKNNPILSGRFKSTSSLTILQMTSDLASIFANPEPEEMIKGFADSHMNHDISEEEFDEFIQVFLETCGEDVEFGERGQIKVGQTITKIRNALFPMKSSG